MKEDKSSFGLVLGLVGVFFILLVLLELCYRQLRSEPPRDSLNYAESAVFDAVKSWEDSKVQLFHSLLAKDSDALRSYEDRDKFLELAQKWQSLGVSLWRLAGVSERKVSESSVAISNDLDFTHVVEEWEAEVDLTVDTAKGRGELFARFVLRGEVSYDRMTSVAEARERERMSREIQKAMETGRGYSSHANLKKNEMGSNWSGNPKKWYISKIIFD